MNRLLAGPGCHSWILLVLVVALSGAGVGPASAELAYVGLTCGSTGPGAISPGCDVMGWWNRSPYIATVQADGSAAAALAGGEGGSDPTWSPDGARIAFARDGEIWVVGAAGGTPVNLTNHPAYDWSPVWAPDGARLAFASDRDGQTELYLMNADGSGVVRISDNVGFLGAPAWSPDGTRIAYDCEIDAGNQDICSIDLVSGVAVRLTNDPASDSGAAFSPDGTRIALATTRYGVDYELALMNADGSGVSRVGAGVVGADPAWSADGTWIAFARLPDAQCGICVYVVKADGTNLSLLVTDGYGPAWNPTGIGSPSPNTPPVASFTVACTGLTCSFDGSGSSDSDGTIASYTWDFGDGTIGSGPTVSHTYPAGSTYTVTLTVTDNGGATGAQSQNVTVSPAFMHLGDLARASTNQGSTWTAIVTVTVHDSGHNPVANATVSSGWSNGGTGSCTTNGSGQCTVSQSTIPRKTGSVTFTVTNVTHATLTYRSAANHDPDGDSNGTRITVNKP